MSDVKDKAKEQVDRAANAAAEAAKKIADKSVDLAHAAGKKMEQGGKTLKKA